MVVIRNGPANADSIYPVHLLHDNHDYQNGDDSRNWNEIGNRKRISYAILLADGVSSFSEEEQQDCTNSCDCDCEKSYAGHPFSVNRYPSRMRSLAPRTGKFPINNSGQDILSQHNTDTLYLRQVRCNLNNSVNLHTRII